MKYLRDKREEVFKMAKIKLEGSDIWETVPVPTEEEKAVAERRYNEALEAVQEMILKNISNIKLSAEFEDGREPATMSELQKAVSNARTEELEAFASAKGKKHYLPFEDGYIVAIF